jgi:hypothetical protein
VQKGALPSETVTFSSETTTVEGKQVTRPVSVLGTVPPGVTCSTAKELKELKTGCRALKFIYAKETKATGENESEWGEYNGRLKEVLFIGYEKAAGLMEEKTVKKFLYDKQGRLRAEWDPRISPSLKTIYGYDSESHVTAITAPGQETWAFVYGTTAADAGAGRVLKATQAPVSASLWAGQLPKNTEVPKLSGSPVVKVRMTVSDGAWSGSPVVYGYQWMDCNTTGGECVPIPGATNANYTPASSDIGHTLVVDVSAVNGGGTVMAMSAASAKVSETAAEITQYALPANSGPANGMVLGADSNVWFVDDKTSKVGKITTAGAITEYAFPEGSSPESIAVGSDNNLWVTDYKTSKIGKVTTSGSVTEYALPSGSGPEIIAAGPDSNLWFTNLKTSKIGMITTAGSITEYALPVNSEPFGITSGPDKNLWFVDYGTNKVGKITTSGAITEYHCRQAADQ